MKCVMCGEKEAELKIPNPNDSASLEMWDVCRGCDDFISRGQNLALECLLQHKLYGKFDSKKLTKKWMEDPNPQVDKFDSKKVKK